MADPLTLGMCRDMLRHIYMLQGIGFIESELAAYKAFEIRRFAQMPPVPAPVPVVPAPVEPVAPVAVPVPAPAPVVPIPAEPVAPVAAPAPVPVPVIPPTHPICTILKEGALPVALVSASAGAGAAPAPAENKIIDVPAPLLTEKRRYERSEIPDEHRCTQLTARGSRCTLGREAATAFCHRHLAKKQSGTS